MASRRIDRGTEMSRCSETEPQLGRVVEEELEFILLEHGFELASVELFEVVEKVG